MSLKTQQETATRHVQAIVQVAFAHDASKQRSLVVYDTASPLARVLTEAYRATLPRAIEMAFDDTTPEAIRAVIDALSPGDLVVLVQSTSFRLNEFRFRLELFNRSLAVIEHPHLGRMSKEEEDVYLDALEYDADYYRGVGHRLKEKIDQAKEIVVACEGTELRYEGAFEPAKLNVGDYTGMKNVGGQFPIGEVFTEPVDLRCVSGKMKIFAFADDLFRVVALDEPIVAVVEEGVLVRMETSTPEFDELLKKISDHEPLHLRELGFGMNRAMTKTRRLTDIGSYERMCGIHVSLGAKHPIYTKEGMSRRGGRYHIDVFVDTTAVMVDGVKVFDGEAYVL